jgi:hypothetical protein
MSAIILQNWRISVDEVPLFMLISCFQKTKKAIKLVNRTFVDVAKFRYLGITLTDQNCMHEEIKSRLILGNACYHSVLSFVFLPAA